MSDTAKDQALAQVASITAMVAALEVDYDRLEELQDERDGVEEQDEWDQRYGDELAELKAAAGECTSQDEAQQRIQEDALSLEVRSGWQSLGEPLTAEEFRIVLCTGGPHVEIVGELDEHKEPNRVRIIYKDWGTSDELFGFDHDPVLTYCRQFYFGE